MVFEEVKQSLRQGKVLFLGRKWDYKITAGKTVLSIKFMANYLQCVTRFTFVPHPFQTARKISLINFAIIQLHFLGDYLGPQDPKFMA